MSTGRIETQRGFSRRATAGDFDADGRYRYVGAVGDAMPEGNWARWLASYLLETILRFVVVLERDSAYANLPIYYVRGTNEHVAPDVFFLAGVPHEVRRPSYCLWETGIPPAVVFEILSKGSELKDRVRNRRVYQELGVQEYYWFDPLSCELEALGLDRATGQYRDVKPNADGRYFSSSLSLEVGVERDRIGLFRSGVYLSPSQELLGEAERLRAQEEGRRLAAEVARDVAEGARAAAEQARATAEQARATAEQARVAAEQGRAAADQGRVAAELQLAEERARREELERRLAEIERRGPESLPG